MARHCGSSPAPPRTAHNSQASSAVPTMIPPPWVSTSAGKTSQCSKVAGPPKKESSIRKCTYAPTRPLFLETAEKLRAIADHRLRVLGFFDKEFREAHLYLKKVNPIESGAATKRDGKVGDVKNNDEDDGLWIDELDEIDGEERRPSQSMIDEGAESDAESECVEEPDDDSLVVGPPLDEGMEWEATCGLIGTANQAEEHAKLILQPTKRGLLKVTFKGKKMSGNGAWVYCKRQYCAWIKSLHAGCEHRLDYNPLMTAVFEMVVGWSTRMGPGYRAKTGYKRFNSALDLGGVQQQLAEEKAAQKKALSAAKTRPLIKGNAID